MSNTLIEAATPGLMNMTDNEFSDISSLVYDRFGITLGEKKKALVRGRLNSHLRSNGYESFGDYYRTVSTDDTGEELLSLVDRISTNHSYFFREADHFAHVISDALVKLESTGVNERIHFWSAGCATGEEAYTLGMFLSEYLAKNRRRWKPAILATDISTSALEQAQLGFYSENRVAGIPGPYRKYLKKVDGGYAIADSIKNMVLFRRLNLMQDRYPFKDKFHIVFCRNVMIYFDQETKKQLGERFSRYVHPDGYLYIGHSETLGRDLNEWRYIKPTVYQRCLAR